MERKDLTTCPEDPYSEKTVHYTFLIPFSHALVDRAEA